MSTHPRKYADLQPQLVGDSSPVVARREWSPMAEIFSTVGLVTDVTAVLILIMLSHIEAGMPFRWLNPQGPWGSFKTRVLLLWRNHRRMVWANGGCVLALFVGTGLMVAGIWMGQCR